MNTDERRWIAECLKGRTEPFGQLVLRYQDRLYHAALRIADTPEDAYDVVQDAFLNAYQSLASFKGDSEFFTWLYRIAFNAAISQKRKKKATTSLDAGRNGKTVAEPVDESHGITPGDTMEQGEEEAALHAAIRRLSTEHRAVLVMKDLDGLKYEDIAEAMGVPIGTVRSRLHRARLELRSILEAGANSAPQPVGPGKGVGSTQSHVD